MSDSVLIKGATVITVDARDRVLDADLLIRDGRIERIIERLSERNGESTGESEGQPPVTSRPGDFGNNLDEDVEVIEASGCVVLPGFVQTHIHLCQTIMRGAADDLSLMDWLRRRVWPLEAAHTPESLYASARLGIAEMIQGGTTCALTMETVSHTEAVFRAVRESGFRATVGKCMMDKGTDMPAALSEKTRASIHESLRLLDRWHGEADGRIRYAFAPRFAVSCTRELLEEVAGLAQERGVMIHTHASENREEVAIVRRETGRDNISYLESIGLLGPRTVLAHCVHATDEEIARLAATKTNVSHCPSSNLKLGSGIARVAEMLEGGVKVSLGADGAPCNNRLDMLTEMRTAALLQKARRDPQTLPARTALRMATIEGARALGLDKEVGSLEVGKRADLIVLNLDKLHLLPQPDLVSTIVYSAERADVETVMIDGRVVMRDKHLLTLDEEAVKAAAKEQAVVLAGLCNEGH